jgi:predicted flavoprotein YhiN
MEFGEKAMTIEELKKQFIVDEDVLKARLEPIVAKALVHCRLDKNGQVLITDTGLSGKEQVKLALAARAIGSQMDSGISPDVSVAEISRFTGLPGNQVRARGKDAIEDRFAQSPKTGVYRALPHKVEAFLDSLNAAHPRPRGK